MIKVETAQEEEEQQQQQHQSGVSYRAAVTAKNSEQWVIKVLALFGIEVGKYAFVTKSVFLQIVLEFPILGV